MHFKKILALLVVVVALGALYRFQDEGSDDGGGYVYDYPVFPGVDTDRVVTIRIENLRRSSVVKMERDGLGQWLMTDPLSYPAELGRVRNVLDIVARLRGMPVAESEAQDLEALELDPPIAIVEVTERFEGGARGEDRLAKTRVEVGSLDLDPQRVHVRAPVDGEMRVLRAPRNIFTAIDVPAEEYRAHEILRLSPRQVIGVQRSGTMPIGADDAPVDVSFEAVLETHQWRALRPRRAALDPNLMGTLVRALTSLRAERFHADFPDALAVFGLDPPPMKYELSTAEGDTIELVFGFPETYAHRPTDQRLWLCAVAGYPHVYEVDASPVRGLATAVEDLYDYELVRALRGRVTRAQLREGERVLELRRKGAKWVLRETGGASPVDGALAGAAVDDLFAALEQTEVGTFVEDVAFPREPERAYEVELEDGTVQRGALGPKHVTSDGAEGYLYQREHDEIVGLVDTEAVERIFAFDAQALRTLEVVKLDELALATVRLEDEQGTVRTYDRDGESGRWYVHGTRITADQFETGGAAERTKSIRAQRWVSGPPAPLTDPIRVTLIERVGTESTYVVGLVETNGEMHEEVELDGQRAAIREGLHPALRRLLN